VEYCDRVDGMRSAKRRNRDPGESEVFGLPDSKKDKYPDLRIEEEITAYLSSLAISPTVFSVGTAGSALRR
jgi:hypothetical protein